MKKILSLFFALVTQYVSAAEIENGVLVLTDANFQQELEKHEHILVEFYAPWCGHCKKLVPEYEGAAEVLSKHDPPYVLAKVDATENKVIAEEYGIQGFPTLFFFIKGKKMEYTGGRTKDTIVEWVLKKSGPPSSELTCAVIKEKAADTAVKFIVGFFGSETSSLYTDVHVAAARKRDNVVFVHNQDPECAKEFGLTAGEPSFVFFRNFEEKVVPLGSVQDADQLLTQVNGLTVPTVFEFSEEEIEPVFGQQQHTMVLFRSKEDADAPYMKIYEEAAKKLKGQFLFAISGVKDGIQERLAEFMGVTEDKLPVLRAILPAEMKKYECTTKPAGLTVDLIAEFAENIKAGKLAPVLKSEEPVANEGPLTVIVGKNYNEIVNDPTKDVLVKYYAPWCGHCKKLAPIWDSLAAEYAQVEDLLIAKFDATANEVEGLEIRGYPTLKFFPKDNKQGVDYEGERDLQSFKKWLSEHASSLKGSTGAQHEDL